MWLSRGVGKFINVFRSKIFHKKGKQTIIQRHDFLKGNLHLIISIKDFLKQLPINDLVPWIFKQE
jgi:hypothetical protein